MLLIRIHCARSVRLLSLGTSITICICTRPVGKRLVPNHVWHQTIIFVRAIFQDYTHTKQVLPRMPPKQMKVLSVYTCSWHGSLRVSQGRKTHFYQRGNWFLPPSSFTANANQSNGSVTCAHGGNSWFLPPWKLIFTTVSIDFYHRGNLFLPLWKLFITIERHSKCLVSFEFITMITLNGKPPYNLDTWPWESGWKSFWWHANPPSHPAINLANLQSSSKGWM